MSNLTKQHLTFLLPDLNGGGVQNVVLILAKAFIDRGYRVDLVVCNAHGHLRERLPEHLELFVLSPDKGLSAFRFRWQALSKFPLTWRQRFRLSLMREKASHPLNYIRSLAAYLEVHHPDTLFSASLFPNFLAILARSIVSHSFRLVVSERTHFSAGKPKKVKRARYLADFIFALYPYADAMTAVSKGVAEDLSQVAGLNRSLIATPHNPTLTPDIEQRLSESVQHPWFFPNEPPVLITVGRISLQKDYPTLLRAFARVRHQRALRLMIIGDSGYRKSQSRRQREVYSLINRLGLTQDVVFLGYQNNPMPYLKKARLFVLSSRFEGFPNVLLEALAAGLPIVSTHCPSGPEEILDAGRFGRLVPVGDDKAMAEAIINTLAEPIDTQRQKDRAQHFSYEASINAYEEILFPMKNDHLPQEGTDVF